MPRSQYNFNIYYENILLFTSHSLKNNIPSFLSTVSKILASMSINDFQIFELFSYPSFLVRNTNKYIYSSASVRIIK